MSGLQGPQGEWRSFHPKSFETVGNAATRRELIYTEEVPPVKLMALKVKFPEWTITVVQSETAKAG